MLYLRRRHFRIDADVPIENLDSARPAMALETIDRDYPVLPFSQDMLPFSDRVCAICLEE